MVCLPAEIEAFNSEGARVRLPVRGRKEPVELELAQTAGQALRAAGPGDVKPADFDLVALAMQEPQYRSPGRARAARRGRDEPGAVHVDHEHAAAALSEAHPRPQHRRAEAGLHRCRACGTISSRGG